MSEVNSSASFQAAFEVMAAANVLRKTASASDRGSKSKEKGSRTEKDVSSRGIETDETFKGANTLGASCSILRKMFEAFGELLALIASKFQSDKADASKSLPSSDTSQSKEAGEGSTDSSQLDNNSMVGKVLAAIKTALTIISSKTI